MTGISMNRLEKSTADVAQTRGGVTVSGVSIFNDGILFVHVLMRSRRESPTSFDAMRPDVTPGRTTAETPSPADLTPAGLASFQVSHSNSLLVRDSRDSRGIQSSSDPGH